MKKFILILIFCGICQLRADPTIFAVAGSPAAGKTSFIQKKIKEEIFFLKMCLSMTAMLLWILSKTINRIYAP